jgi:hypothetical protein
MDRQFHLLDTFHARGSDGATYKVCAYEHLRRDETLQDGQDHWLPTGKAELRLDSGELVDPKADGTMVVAHTGVTLTRIG